MRPARDDARSAARVWLGHLESGWTGQELSWLMQDLEVKQLRDEYGADLVSMVVARGKYAGLANCGGSYSVYCGNPTGTLFSFEIVAHTPGTHAVEYTPDFVRWYPMADPDTSGGRATVVDSVASVGARFYRVHAGTKSPPRMIGFYRVAVAAGSTLIANQLDQGDNTVGRVLRDLPVSIGPHPEVTRWSPRCLRLDLPERRVGS